MSMAVIDDVIETPGAMRINYLIKLGIAYSGAKLFEVNNAIQRPFIYVYSITAVCTMSSQGPEFCEPGR
jgi:hypothetical protein